MAAVQPTASRWMYGPVPDLLLGCGLGYAVLFAVFLLFGPEVRAALPLVYVAAIAFLVSIPHYGATLLRAYERREDRVRYAFFTLWMSLLLLAALAAATRVPAVGAALITLYFTWNPWHYAGQNYGLAVMFLRRRGVEVTPALKRWFYASFLLSYVLTFFAIHGDAGAGSYALGSGTGAGEYRYVTLGIPQPLVLGGFAVAGVAYALALVATARLCLRSARWRDLGPAAALTATQALWFGVPIVGRYASPASVGPLSSEHWAYYAVWLVVGHAVQYLWITSYYAAREPSWGGHSRFLLRTLLAGAAIFTVPAVFFTPQLLGGPAWDAGLSLVVVSVVNLHHFLLDGAIWKLREGRVANILIRGLRSGEAQGVAVAPASGVPWLRRAVFVTGAVSLGVIALTLWEGQIQLSESLGAGRLARAEQALDRMAWVGRDNPDVRRMLARSRARAGEGAAAVEHYRRSLALDPDARTWLELGALHERRREWRKAVDAYQSAAALAPGHAGPHYRLGRLWLGLGQRERARRALEQALAAAPAGPLRANVERDLARLRDAPGRS